MNAQEKWKYFYRKWLTENDADDWREDMQSERREAALERRIAALERENEVLNEIMRAAINLGFNYGGEDGAHHKQWTIDQMIRVLAGEKYDQLVAKSCSGEDGPNTYEWDTGIAP